MGCFYNVRAIIKYNAGGNAKKPKEKETLYKESKADYDKAIERAPNIASFYYNRGITNDELDDYDAAIADYGKAITLEPNYAPCYYNRACAKLAIGDLKAAADDFVRAGQLYADSDDFASASGSFYNAYTHFESSDAYLGAAEANLHLENYVGAAGQLRRAKESDSSIAGDRRFKSMGQSLTIKLGVNITHLLDTPKQDNVPSANNYSQSAIEYKLKGAKMPAGDSDSLPSEIKKKK